LSPTKERKRSLIGLIKGKLRFIVTKYLVQKNPNSYIRTPTAVVGVTGNDSVAILDDDTTTTAYHLSGELEITNRVTSEISFITSGEFIKVFPDGRQEVGTITTDQMEEILGFFSGPFPPPEVVKDQIKRVGQELMHKDPDVAPQTPHEGSAKSEDPE
jgi:hypothetical protein